MYRGDVIFIHGFWSGPGTWNEIVDEIESAGEMSDVRLLRFGYESPKFRWPWSRARVPDYDDIAQSLATYVNLTARDVPLVFVTHSQGGLILQRFLHWMLSERRANELRRVAGMVMLACPHEGSDLLRSLRKAAGFSHRPQAESLRPLNSAVADSRRIVLRQIVNAAGYSSTQCPIPLKVYAGRTDRVVPRASAQSAFPDVGVLPGDHFSILHASKSGNLTVPALMEVLKVNFSTAPDRQDGELPPDEAGSESDSGETGRQGSPSGRYNVSIDGGRGVQVGDNNVQHNRWN